MGQPSPDHAAPLVSVYLPTRGRPALLRRAVASVLSQTYELLELLVVIDGPDPETGSELAQTQDPRLRVIALPEAVGACAARNTAIFAAQGYLITGLDDDDEFLPTHVATLVEAWQAGSHAFVCTTSCTIRPEGNLVRHAFRGAVTAQALACQNVVGNQVLTRADYLRDLGGFDPEMPAWQDYDLWIRLAQKYGDGARIDARTYRQYQNHGAERISSRDRIRAGYKRFVSKHEALLGPRELTSLELLFHQTTHTPISLAQWARFTRLGWGARATVALLADRLPTMRRGILAMLDSWNTEQR